MRKNEGPIDRTVRAIVGIALLVWSLGGLHGVAAIVAGVVGAILVITAATGFCLLYRLFRVSTTDKTPA